MERRQFLQLCSLLGLFYPVLGLGKEAKQKNHSKSVLIIGAGAAGLSAGHLLKQQGIDCQILEASSSYGGRMKRTLDFADFPISLGAEWLHVDVSELRRIVADASVMIDVQTKGYASKASIGFFDNDKLTIDILSHAFGTFQDRKFVGSSWFDFFETYIVPNIKANIQLDTQVTSVNFQADKVQVMDSNNHLYEADQVIITTPINILREGDIDFMPSLAADKLNALRKAPVWGGIKVFIEFSEAFYPTYLVFPDSETDTGQRLYYDATYAQDSSHHILGLFAVGEQARSYQALSGDALRDYILRELDDVFEGIASHTYIKHQAQNWSEEPYIRSAYLADNAPSYISKVLAKPIDNKIFFAGDAYTQQDDWGGVHNAARSARDVIELILQHK